MKRRYILLSPFFLFLISALCPLPSAFAQLPADKPIKVKVAVVIQDPALPQYGGKKMHEVIKTPGRTFMWNDPRELSKEYEAALEKISHGVVQYEVVKIIDDTLLFSNRNDNNQPVGMTEMVKLLMEPDWITLKNIGTHFDYKRFVEHYGFDKMRDRDEIHEVWVWSFPYGGMWESNYCGKTGFWLNSDPTTTTTNEKLLVVMGLNYERKMSLALESYGHRTESVLWHLYGRWDREAAYPNNWEKYTQFDMPHPGLANIGNIHFPPNGSHDYDWVNKTPVTTCADGWNYYPDIRSDMTRTVDCTEWQCSHEGYMSWWFGHLPHFAGINPADGHLNNWWRYVVNWEEAIKAEKADGEKVKKGKEKRGEKVSGDVSHKTTIGLLESLYGGKEQGAVLDYLRASPDYKVKEIDLGSFKKAVFPQECPVIWYHKPDTELLAADTSKQTIALLKKYVEAGGSLFLSMDALRLLPCLGVEKEAPTVNFVELKDEGNGRKLGLHGFRSHPVFDGLLGGAYTYAPKEDVKVRRVGWFGKSVPQGKVVAVDWAYIFIYEDSKLITEYTMGKGKILAVGAYLDYYQPNFNRAHLEKFTSNVLNYLIGGRSESVARYWDFEPGKVVAAEFSTPDITRAAPVKWELTRNPITLTNPAGAKNMWDIAGERMVIMGKEAGGIDEIWAHPYLAIRDYEVAVRFGSGKAMRLNELTPKVEVGPESFIRTYTIDTRTIREVIACHPVDGTAVIHYEYSGDGPADIGISFKSNLRFMWPYSEKVTGALKYGWDKGLNGWVIENKTGEFVTVMGTNRTARDQKATAGNGLIVGAGMNVTLNSDETVDVVMATSATGHTEAVSAYRRAMLDPKNVYLAAVNNTKSLFNGKLSITGPETDFNTGYKWAVAGTDKFIVNTPGVGRSLVAGYATTDYGWKGGHAVNGRPGYAWYFGRDAVWSSFAVLDYGDFDRVKTVLELFARYQDVSGKIYHELTTSGIAHYDAADATPLYIILAGRYLQHSGDIEFIRKQWPAIKKAIDFCYSTDTDGDHLIENTQQGHGWEEGGDLYVTHTTQYMVSCWAEALSQASYMAKFLDGHGDLAKKYAAEKEVVLTKLNTNFWNPQTQFFNHGLYKDGSYLAEPSVMTAIPVAWSQIVEPWKSKSVVDQIASCNFTTDWGTRIVSEKAKFFAPGGYHTGSVWPLFTGWAALGDYAVGNNAQGFSKMMSNLLVYKNWSLGYIEEVLHGTQYKYFGVCRHQAWSETMVLEPAMEGMLGLKPDAMNNTIGLSLRFPFDWDTVNVENIRLGENRFSFKMRRTPQTTSLAFSNLLTSSPPQVNLTIPLPQGTEVERVLLDGKKAKFKRTPAGIEMDVAATDKFSIDITQNGGISVLPLIHHPAPGDSSIGMKIISDQLIGEKYVVKTEGLSGTSGKVRVLKSGKVTEEEFTFPKSKEKYSQKDLIFYNGKPANEVFYYVLVRSFYDSNGDGTGDLNGLRMKLDYLQELGVTSILMLPLYEAEVYHNYFAKDYWKIDPEYGTMDDLKALIREVHKRGMRIYLDMETQYFTEGSDWYANRKDLLIPGGTLWGRMLSYDGTSRNCSMADLYNPEVRKYFFDLYKFFLDPNKDGKFDDGADGFRIDHIMDDLDNMGKLTNLYAGFWKPLFNELRSINPNIRIIGEQSDWGTYGREVFDGADLDFLFAFQEAFAVNSLDKNQLINKIDSTNLLTPGNRDQLVFIENHDLDRFASRMNGSLQKGKVGAAFNVLLRGIPLIYYGQELGMKGVKYEGKSDGNDIPRREAFEWYRSTDGPGMAHWYKDTGPWWTNRNGKSNDGISLDEQRADKNSLWNFYKTLLGIRKAHPAILGGDLRIVANDNPGVISFVRRLDSEEVLVVINLTGKPQTATIQDDVSNRIGTVLLSEPFGSNQDKQKIKMKPFGIFVAENK